MFLIVNAGIFAAIIAVTAAISFAVAVFRFKQQRRAARRAEMMEFARQREMTFFEKDEFGLLSQLSDFELFSREKRRLFRNGKIENLMRKQVGDVDVFLFDYSYVVQAGKTPVRITQTVFFAQNKDWSLPNFRLEPETWKHKVLEMLGRKDINFDESPEFSQQFWLTSKFEEMTRNAFSPEVRQFLIERPAVHMEGNNFYFIAYKPKKELNPDEASLFFDHCCRLTELLKKGEKMELLDFAEIQKVAEKLKEFET